MNFQEQTVSIIIPVYNTARYLEKCLDSVIRQTYPYIEIICVNDGSKDNSLDILNEYATHNTNIKILNQDNGGQSSARNIGIKVSTGRWIMFLDSDDWLEPDTVERAYAAAVANDCDIVSFDYICEYTTKSEERAYLPHNKTYNGREFFLRILGPISEQLNEPHKLDALSIVCAKLYKAELITNTAFRDYKIIGPSEDTLFNLEVAKKTNKAIYLRYAGYHYRKTNGGAITQTYKPNLIDKWNNLYDYIETFVCSPIEEEAFNNRIACSLIGSGVNEMKSKDSFFKKRAWVKNTLSLERYQKAFALLNLKYITTLHWKLFFYSAKHRHYTMVTLLLIGINKLLCRKANK